MKMRARCTARHGHPGAWPIRYDRHWRGGTIGKKRPFSMAASHRNQCRESLSAVRHRA
ncbi:MAG: hypothetical protein I8H86_00850 [Sphingomonadaceae bacterium]|nr:hypothetical protein [Sphingomonadaceae bacterium]